MNAHKKFSILSLVVFLSLVLSLVFPVAAMADDGTPSPPAAPAADNSSAQIGSPESSANAAAPSDAAPVDAAPKDVAPADAAATDGPSSSTDVTPTDAAATDGPASSTAAVATDVAIEPTADVVAALTKSGGVLVDENNNPLPLSSKQAADVLSGTDPWFDAGGGVIVGYSSTTGCASGVTECHPNISTPIQAAIDDSRSTGTTIFVEPGVYNESPNITKSLTLQSTGGRDVTTLNLQTGPTYLGSLTIGGTASNVTINGFTIAGFDAAGSGLASSNIFLGTDLGNIIISNNRIQVGNIGSGSNGDDGFGILTTYNESPALNVDNLTVTDNIFEPVNSTGTRAFYINPGVTNFTFQNNQIDGNFSRTAITQANNGLVDDNTVTGTGSSAGLGTWGYPDPNVYGQTLFSNNNITGTGTAISIFDTNNVKVKNNKLDGNGTGVRTVNTGSVSGLNASTITVNNNSLGNNTVDVSNGYSVGTLDASGNWWGTNTLSGVSSSVSGSVDYTPWLNSGTDTSIASGFQGDFSILDVGANSPQTGSMGRIQEGLDLVTAGGTVLVAPGTYAENIIISTPVTLRSISGPASTFIDSSITGNPYIVFIAASDVTLDGFDISSPGYAGSADASGVVVEPPYVPNAQIRITNNIIHDIGTPGRTTVAYGNVGINIGAAQGVEIDHNQIFNIIHNDPAAWSNGISIWGGGFGTPSGNIIIHDNSFHDISSPYPADADISTQTDVGSVTVYDNSLISTLAHPTEFGVEVRDTNTVMAENNWWGNATGPYDNSGGIDACGLTINNPTGSGNPVSTCVIYDPWLTRNPFSAGGTGTGSGGNDQGHAAAPIVTPLIPVTGGQPTTLSCSNSSVAMLIGDIQVTFTGLCGYEVVLNLVAKEDLPGDLGAGNSFDDGLSITLLKNGKEIKTIPADAGIRVSYPMPSSGSPSVMVWSGSSWIDQASFVDGNNITSKLLAPATLVLVTH